MHRPYVQQLPTLTIDQADEPARSTLEDVRRKLGFVPTGRMGGRHSLARAGAVESVEYALDLEADMGPAPFARAA